MPTDPATIPLPGDEPERHVRLCDIPDTLREMRESAERYRALYAQELTRAERLERELKTSQYMRDSAREHAAELRRKLTRIEQDDTSREIKRLRAEVDRLKFSRDSLQSDHDIKHDWLLDELAKRDADKCPECRGDGCFRDDVTGDDMQCIECLGLGYER